MNIKLMLEDNPVIAAVKNEEQLNCAVNSSSQIIFVLFGDIISIKRISDIIHEKNKIGIIHVDLVEGFNSKVIVNKYIKEVTRFDGIISTKPQILKSAKECGLIAIQRVFVFDTLSLNNVENHFVKECDAVEVLPGVIPKILTIISKQTKKPVVAGGLIESKEEVIQALNAGASSVSSTKKYIWEL